jgi:lipopolysaccharide export system permease protein
MFKIYEKYIIKKFLIKFTTISLIFLSLTIILNVFEEISFFKNTDSNFLVPYFLTLLNSPITLFEIFPFVFLISTQLLFYEIFKKDELILLKNSGLSNLKIITTLFFSSLVLGFLMIIIYYNLASKLKFYYTDIKNNFTNDNKYLAVVNDSGLWLKDETDKSILIVKSNHIKDNYLMDVIINQFDFNFNHLKTIQSKKVDISNKKWVIYSPIITEQNITSKKLFKLNLESNFDVNKINSLFSNFSTLNLLELFYLKEDYEVLGYSSDEVMIHLLKLFSTPFFYSLMTVLSAVIMFNINKKNSLFFHIVLGIVVSVLIYYINFMFISLGNTGKIPIDISVFLPILFISIITTMGLIRINEK